MMMTRGSGCFGNRVFVLWFSGKFCQLHYVCWSFSDGPFTCAANDREGIVILEFIVRSGILDALKKDFVFLWIGE